jgi:hypothetical protein
MVPPEAQPAAARAALALAAQVGYAGALEILESCGIPAEPVTWLSTRHAGRR